ncbi:MAG: hypothetical protein H6816_08575 [Phycisphaerales bacterium]|nr:hypothetical protein [Phycisphaerales bacterium]
MPKRVHSLATLWAVCVCCAASTGSAAPNYVAHNPADGVFNNPGATQRTPLQPREDETVYGYFKTGPSFSYTSAAVYYTDDGSTPSGTKGVGSVGTFVLLSYGPDIKVNFLFNEPLVGGTDDWWEVVFPAFTSEYGKTIKYKIGVWDGNTPGSPEVFANAAAVLHTWIARSTWPGAGAPDPNRASATRRTTRGRKRASSATTT